MSIVACRNQIGDDVNGNVLGKAVIASKQFGEVGPVWQQDFRMLLAENQHGFGTALADD
jgi:hypothetical protein